MVAVVAAEEELERYRAVAAHRLWAQVDPPALSSAWSALGSAELGAMPVSLPGRYWPWGDATYTQRSSSPKGTTENSSVVV